VQFLAPLPSFGYPDLLGLVTTKHARGYRTKLRRFMTNKTISQLAYAKAASAS